MAEHLAYIQQVIGSSPIVPTKRVEIAECWQTTNAIVHSKSAICDST